MKEIVPRAEVELVGAVWPGQALVKVAAFEKLLFGREMEEKPSLCYVGQTESLQSH